MDPEKRRRLRLRLQFGTDAGQETIGEEDVSRQVTGPLKGPMSPYEIRTEIGKSAYATEGSKKVWEDVGLDLDNVTEKDAIWYVAGLGMADTYRGLKTIIGDEKVDQYEADRQAVKNHLVSLYPDAEKYYYIGAALDPAIFFLPQAKGKSLYELGKFGMGAGAAVGAAGYYDPSIGSVLTPGQPMSRTEGAILGSTAGGLFLPAATGAGRLAKKAYKPYGEKMWQVMKRNPAYGLAAGGGVLGWNRDTDQEFGERALNAMKWVLIGTGTGLGIQHSPIKGWLGKRAIAEYGLPDNLLDMKAIAANERATIRRDLESVTEQLQDLPIEVRKAMYSVMNDLEDYDDAIVGLTTDQIKLYHAAEDKITKYGRQLVDVGALDEATWFSNVGRYMHQIYSKPDAEETISQALRKTMMGDGRDVATQGDALRMRGHRTFINAEQWKLDKDYYLGGPSPSTVAQRTDPKTGELIKPEDYHKWPEESYSVVHNPLAPKTSTPESALGWKIIDENEAGVMLRRPWTTKEREAMGNIEDVALSFQATGRLMANDVASFRFYQAVADTYGTTLPKGMDVPKGYNLVLSSRIGGKGVERYGALTGKILPENIYHDIISMDAWRRYGAGGKLPHPKLGGTPSRVWNGYRALNRWWKSTKTVLNAPVHVGNVTSNIMHYDLLEGSVKAFKAGRTDMRDRTNRFKLAEDWDVFSGTLASNEIMSKNKSLYDAYKLDGVDTIDKFIINSSGITKGLAKGVKATKEQTFDRLVSLYQWEDYIFRMGLFNTRITQGAEQVLRTKGIRPDTPAWKRGLAALEDDPPTELLIKASREAREGFVDYGKNSPFTYAMKDSLIPFISYTWGIVPRLAETAVKRPEKIAKWSLILGGMNKMFYDLSEDKELTDMERAQMSEQDKQTLFGLPGTADLTLGPLPGGLNPYKKTGESAYFKMHRMIPGGMFGETAEERGGVVPGIPTALQPTGGFMGTVVDAARGQDPFLNKEMATLGERGKYIARQMSPNIPISGVYVPRLWGEGKLGEDLWNTGLTPPTWAGEKMRRGLVPREGGYTHPHRDTQTPTSATLQNLGFRVTPYDLDKMTKRTEYKPKFSKKIKKLKKDLYDLVLAEDAGLWDGREKQYDKKLATLEDKLEKALEAQFEAQWREKPRKGPWSLLYDALPEGRLLR
jgi:hypothetical protein